MNQQGRNKLGKFSPKSDENRHVRSIRLTDVTWNALGELAGKRGITRADLIEGWFVDSSFSLDNIIKSLELEINNLKANSVYLSESVLDNLNKIANERSITREELIANLLANYVSHNLRVEVVKHTQLDLLPEPENESNINVGPLNNTNLAKRLGVDASNLKKQSMKSEDKFLIYSASKDPDNLGWKYSQIEKLYYPVFN
jgi:predicted DNA-binding ribbon-helix-helix protein